MDRSTYPQDFTLFLASASPRRRELLTAARIPFTVVRAPAEEMLAGTEPRRLAEENARRKVRAALLPEDAPARAFVLGADTLVVVDGLVLGKPGSPEEAREMLTLLSGRDHEVLTGVALGCAAGATEPSGPGRATTGGPPAARGDLLVGSARTVVTMRPLERMEIQAYVASEEWRDKAGGYAIQGLASLLVAGIRGDYSNVVGLPLGLVADLLRLAGFDPLTRRWSPS